MRSSIQKTKDLAVFALLAAFLLVSQIALRPLPGIQLNGILIAAITLTYRTRALIPVYVYVLLFCLYYGFFSWNLPYFYIWIPLWGMFMVAGKLKLSKKVTPFVYMFLCGLYGLSFGALYSPAWAIVAGLDFKQTLTWIVAGLPADITHAVNNFVLGITIVPLSNLLRRLQFESQI